MGITMQLSHYIKTYPCKEKPGYLLLFSTKRASIIMLPCETLNAAKEGALSPSEQETLARLGFLVPDAAEEKRELTEIFDRANKSRRHLNAMAVMNLDCNLDCTYCYEGTMKGRRYMSRETADLLADFIRKHHIAAGKNVNIDFYGGEPLLSIDMVKHIAEKVKTAAEEKGATFTCSLVTNGTLLTGKIAGELKALGCGGAKVTLDGPKIIHDKQRPFKSGRGSFDIIIKNIKEASRFMRIQIGGNYTLENYKDFPGLLDYLTAEGLTPDTIGIIKFDPITKTNSAYAMPEFNEGCDSTEEPGLIEASAFLREEILKRGFNTPKITPVFCMVEIEDELVVNYEGTIYKCPAFIGWKGFEAGSLESGIKDYSRSHRLGIWKKEECLDCEYLPLCFGGCRFLKMLKDGNLDGVECRRAYLDAVLETFLMQELKYRQKAGKS